MPSRYVVRPKKRNTYAYAKRRYLRKSIYSLGKRVNYYMRKFAEKKSCAVGPWATEEVDYTGHRHSMCLIAQGSGEDQRIGRMITPHSFTAKIQLTNIATASSANVVTWTAVIIRDNQQVGDAIPALSDVFNSMGTTSAPMSLIQAGNKGRFSILRRWSGVLYATTGAGNTRYLDLYHRFKKPFNVRYNGTASTDIEANGLVFALITNRPGTDNFVYATGVGRLWYTDV